MDARNAWAAAMRWSAAFPRAALLAALLAVAMGAQQRTANFIIETPDPQFAQQVAQAAEKYRHDLAVAWLGKAMPNWAQPCEMKVDVGQHLGAGGATRFVFDHGEVFNWVMTIQGSRERLLDSVLPHEITHMVFASHFRQPLPRWADEGGATSVEHASEKNKQRNMLNQFLRTGRGIAFNQMFAMTEYPQDIMPLYSQGYSLAEYLIQTGGRRKYIEFLGDGLNSDDWSGAVNRHYGLGDLGRLQTTWLAWVQQGMPPLQARTTQPAAAVTLVSNGPRSRPEPNLIYHVRDRQSAVTPLAALVPVQIPATRISTLPSGEGPGVRTATTSSPLPLGDGQGVRAVASAAPLRPATAIKWLDPSPKKSLPELQMAAVDSHGRPAAAPASGWRVLGADAAASVSTSSSADVHATEAAHPQPLEKPRQTVIE